MIRWLISPEHLSDEELLREYGLSSCKDDRTAALLAEIEQRKLDLAAKKKMVVRWTVERDDQLVRRLKDGESVMRIARSLGRTEAAVLKRLKAIRRSGRA